jgi:hypothetical protein
LSEARCSMIAKAAMLTALLFLLGYASSDELICTSSGI